LLFILGARTIISRSEERNIKNLSITPNLSRVTELLEHSRIIVIKSGDVRGNPADLLVSEKCLVGDLDL